MCNYPDGMSQYKDHPSSPEFDDKGLEDLHVKKMIEVEKNIDLVAKIISDLSADDYVKMTASINESLGFIGRLMSDALSDADCDSWQRIVAGRSMSGRLPVVAGLIVEEAISDYAMKEVLN